MARLRYGLTPWTANGARATASYPRLTTDLEIPVVIVGGGLTGAATAYAFAAAGIRSVLRRSRDLGGGATMSASGVALAEPSSSVRGSRVRARPSSRARGVARDQTIGARVRGDAAAPQDRCGYEPLDLVLVAQAGDQSKQLAREMQTRKDAGLEISGLSARSLAALGVSGGSGVRTRGHARLDPCGRARSCTCGGGPRGRRIRANARDEVKTTRGYPEPFLYVILLWITRRRPWLCGMILGFGFMQRPLPWSTD